MPDESFPLTPPPCRFLYETRPLPVLWHQSLLTLVQRYKEDMSAEQKEAVLDLIKRQTHHQVGGAGRGGVVSYQYKTDKNNWLV